MSYVLQLEEIAREIDAYNVAANLAAAMGRDVSPLDWEDVRNEFDRLLAGEPEDTRVTVRSARDIKLRALGIPQGGTADAGRYR